MPSLAEVDDRVGVQVTYLAGQITNKIKETADDRFPAERVTLTIRFLCVLGHILRYCADLVECVAQSPHYQVRKTNPPGLPHNAVSRAAVDRESGSTSVFHQQKLM